MEWFEKKFYDKTLNEWQEREKFVHVDRKYLLVDRDFEQPESIPEVTETKSIPKLPDSNLPTPLQGLIKLIFNLELMEQQMMEVGYDGMNSVDEFSWK